MLTIICVLTTPVLPVTRGAHVFSVVLSVGVGALGYFHDLFWINGLSGMDKSIWWNGYLDFFRISFNKILGLLIKFFLPFVSQAFWR